MRKVLGIIAASMLVTMLAGCGNSGSSQGGTTGASGTDTQTEASNLEEVTWKISHTQAPDHFMNIAMENLSSYVSEHTDGKFKIEVFHSGTLGSEQDVIESMQMGTVAGNLASTSLLSNFVPSYNVFNLPGIFKDEQAIQKVMSDDELMVPMRAKALEQNIMEVGYFQDYFRMVYSKEPITGVDSFRGVKIRVMSSPVLIDTFQALGCNTTTTAWSELYSGLQLGVVDGLDHVSTSVKAMNFYDHVKYASDPKIFATPMFLVISKPLYDKLPSEYQAVLDEGMRLALEELNSVANETNEADKLFLQTEGKMEFVECDIDAIHEVITPVREKYMNELEPWVREIGAKILEMQ